MQGKDSKDNNKNTDLATANNEEFLKQLYIGIKGFIKIIKDITSYINKNKEKVRDFIDGMITSDIFISLLVNHFDYFITDEELLNEIKNKNLCLNKQLFESFLCEYYSRNDFLKIKELFKFDNVIAKYKYILKKCQIDLNLDLKKKEKELDYFLDIINKRVEKLSKSNTILKNDETLEVYLISFIPLLLSQLTGIMEDIDNIIYKKININKYKRDRDFIQKYFGDFIDLNDDLRSFALIYWINIKNGIFNTIKIENLNQIKIDDNFKNRHKILHGDKDFLDLEYNKKETLIRLSQYFNFLSIFYLKLVLLQTFDVIIYPEI